VHLWSLSGKLSGNPLSCLRILRAEDRDRDEMSSGVSADRGVIEIGSGKGCRRDSLRISRGYAVAVELDVGRRICGLGFGWDVAWMRGGDGSNGAGELWRLFGSGQVRSAGAAVGGTTGKASGRANGFNHIEGLQSRSFRDWMWRRFHCARLQVSKTGGQDDIVRNGGGGLPIRLVSDLRHVLDRSRVPVWLGARCWMIHDLLSRSDAVNTGGVEECSGGQPAAASAKFALPGFSKPQRIICWGLLKPG